MTEHGYIDNETGAHGNVEDLHFVDDLPSAAIIEGMSNEEVIKYGAKYGMGMEQIIEDSRVAGALSVKPDVTLEQFETLAQAAERLIDAIINDGECMACGQTYGFHSANCQVHDIHTAIDQVEL